MLLCLDRVVEDSLAPSSKKSVGRLVLKRNFNVFNMVTWQCSGSAQIQVSIPNSNDTLLRGDCLQTILIHLES